MDRVDDKPAGAPAASVRQGPALKENTMDDVTVSTPAPSPTLPPLDPNALQAFKILHVGYTLLPIIAGADKFAGGILTNWDQYLSPTFAKLSPAGGHNLMLAVGAIEIVAGIGVVLKPRIFAYVVAAWLWAIVLNLLLVPGYFDIALRDLGLSLGALALARLAASVERR
jgi:hypothetical protein